MAIPTIGLWPKCEMLKIQKYVQNLKNLIPKIKSNNFFGVRFFKIRLIKISKIWTQNYKIIEN
jgi:hypothetical protein